LDLLLEFFPTIDVNATNEDGLTCIDLLIEYNNFDSAFVLIGRGIKVDLTLLSFKKMAKMCWGEQALFIILMDKGMDVTKKSSTGKTLLHVSVKRRDVHTMARIIEKFPEAVNIKNQKGDFPIDLTADKKIIEILLKNGASPNTPKSPLLNAILHGNLKITKLLIEYGANHHITFVGSTGETTPIERAALALSKVRFLKEEYGSVLEYLLSL
jgi:ankyrin repeat protein